MPQADDFQEPIPPFSEDMLGASCLLEAPPAPCALVIFGASGDLAGRKLLPALYNLFANHGLPAQWAIVGAARTPWSDEEFRERMRQAVARVHGPEPANWPQFAARLFYQPLIYDDPESYRRLAARLRDLDGRLGLAGNRVFNLAMPPVLYAQVATMIGQNGLAAQGREGQGWARLVVEKPFGRDLKSAQALNRAIAAHFPESAVFRIDHYLAKETVQSVLMLRFANAIFEPLWNRNYIDHVSILAAESLGVEHRAGYYESAGVLRDMFQNHMMQLMSLCALEPPSLFFAERVRDEKTKAFRSLRPFPVDSRYEHLVLGQYQAGQIEGRPVPAYRQEPGVDAQSLTPTFAMMRLFIDNWRWQGVPFFLLSGKRLAAKVTRMVIHFKEVPHSLFRQVLGPHISANRLVLGVYPQEAVTLSFQTKNPGARVCLRSANLFFDYNEGQEGPRPEAYEKALLDCIAGDQMLFWRQDAVELCWSYLDELIESCESCQSRAMRLRPYVAGSWGPPEALGLLGGRPAPWD
jgi:glucose-6-phosphate 1-dehydrogenase